MIIKYKSTNNKKYFQRSPLGVVHCLNDACCVVTNLTASSQGVCLQIYVVGGLQTNMTAYAPFVEVYDPVLDQWEVPVLTPDIEPRAFAAICTL